MKSYLFEIPGEPFAKQRARTLRTGRSYTPAKTVQYENLVKTCFMQKYPCESPTEDFAVIEIIAVYPVPQSWTKKNKIRASQNRLFPKRHDWDNIGKIICDGLQGGVLFHNDNQIIDGYVHKRFGDRPRTVVMVTVLDEETLEKMDMMTPEAMKENFEYYVGNE